MLLNTFAPGAVILLLQPVPQQQQVTHGEAMAAPRPGGVAAGLDFLPARLVIQAGFFCVKAKEQYTAIGRKDSLRSFHWM
jgi:hypothetical protein